MTKNIWRTAYYLTGRGKGIVTTSESIGKMEGRRRQRLLFIPMELHSSISRLTESLGEEPQETDKRLLNEGPECQGGEGDFLLHTLWYI